MDIRKELKCGPSIEAKDIYLHKKADSSDETWLIVVNPANIHQESLEICNFQDEADIIKDELCNAYLEIEGLETNGW